LKEPLAPADPVEAVRWFKREAKLAARRFVNDPEDGQLRALKALIRHGVALFQDDPLVLCMFKSLAAERHPRKPNAHSPWIWMQRAWIAAALDAMLLLPGTDEHKAAEAIYEELKKLGITLNKNRNEKFNADTVVNLRKSYLAGAADEAAIKLSDTGLGNS
jgi:hypothetical protein